MLVEVEVENYRSFLKAKAKLSRFTLVIGPNGAGKSNFLRLLRDATLVLNRLQYPKYLRDQKHYNNSNIAFQKVKLTDSQGKLGVIKNNTLNSDFPSQLVVEWFALNPSSAGLPEQIQPNMRIASNGVGVVNVLDSLKTGAREDLFDKIEKNLKRYIPSIKKLSTKTTQSGQKRLQVSEHGINQPFLASELSDGTQLLLIILTILHQEQPPKVILLEDVDRGLHPRLFQGVVELLQDIAEQMDIQIIATTHNPYLIDEFNDNKEAVLIVEKNDGQSTITSLANRVKDDKVLEDDTLGSLWFGGFVGGVPKKK